MDTNPRERGQALIIIVLTIVGLFGLTGLVIDGGVSYSDRRKAQNAADSAALAAALGDIRGRDITTTAKSTAAVDGFDDNGTSNWVTVSSKDAPPRSCADTPKAKDITVQIRSVLNTYFATVIGIRQVGNTVTATARACEPYVGPLFNGDGWRKPFDGFNIGLIHLTDKLPRIGRKRLHISPLAFGVNGVKGQGRFARARQAGEHHQLVARNRDVDVLEIVLARAADGDGTGVVTGRTVGHQATAPGRRRRRLEQAG